MKKPIFASVILLAALGACNSSNDDDDGDDVKRETEQTEPATECTARCTGEKETCVKACLDDDCRTVCADTARKCEVDCE